mmetsp:Transcript_43673/g.111632  ORF Transcript_43673/g.111632 Transcript_43673/m.111632 type:complete len:160 (+) Transcript_43673:366-845(+)|eukprot:jgi/Tetstr1/430272/TSEL_020100.t1
MSDGAPSGTQQGVVVSDDVLMHAWKVLNPEDNAKLSRSDLQAYVDIFFPKNQPVDLKSLVKSSGISFDKLKQLVQDNELQNFDPAAEAFKVLDPAGTGFADLDTMRAILSQMPGIGDVTDDDMKVVLELADSDMDGKISLQDFGTLNKYVPRANTKDSP